MSVTLTDSGAAVSFLQGLFGSAFGYVLLWTMPDKTSWWFDAAALTSEPERTAATVERLADNHDVYVGVSLFSQQYGPDQRGKSTDASGIPGLWLDLDIAHAVHAKTNLPATEEEALSLFTDHGLPAPTIVVHSGHGLQLWWLFREPWMFEDQADQQRAAGLAVAWQKTIRGWALQRGWTVDSTADLSRVMRLPGTLNLKDPEDIRPVVLRSVNGLRYNPSDFTDYLSTDAVEASSKNAQDGPRTAQGATFTLDLDAVPPFERFEALRTNSRKFRQTWDRKRADFPSGDYSASSYDLALANLTAQAGWTDQEVVDTCIAWRRKHGELDPKKALRVDYWQRFVLERAKDNAGKVNAATEILAEAQAAWDQATAGAPPPGEDGKPEPTPDMEAARSKLLEAASKVLGVRIDGVVRLLTAPPQYAVIMGGQELPLGNADHFQSLGKFRSAMIDARLEPIGQLKQQIWFDVLKRLVAACVDRQVGVTIKDTMLGWLDAYFRNRQPMSTLEAAWTELWPYRTDGRLYIFFDDFYHFVSGLPERPRTNDVGMALRTIGATLSRKDMPGSTKSNRVQRRIWALPPEMDHADGEESS